MNFEARHIELVRDIVCQMGPKAVEHVLERTLDGHVDLAKLKAHDDLELFKLIVFATQFTGIRDSAARNYLESHGGMPAIAEYALIQEGVEKSGCPYIRDFETFNVVCDFKKGNRNCKAKPAAECIVKKLDCRRGELNIAVVSLYLFLSQCYEDKLSRLFTVAREDPDPVGFCIKKLTSVRGIGNKVANMVLADLFFPLSHKDQPIFNFQRDGCEKLVVIDTLVHNFLERSGILKSVGSRHNYGAACYETGNCKDIILDLAKRIDPKEIVDRRYRNFHPRLIQWCIWRHCAEDGKKEGGGVCNQQNRECRECRYAQTGLCDRAGLHERGGESSRKRNATRRILRMLDQCSGGDPIFPPTDLFNEGWMLRLILDWCFNEGKQSNHPPIVNTGRWYSEALLPSPFLPRYRGDKLGESWTHADAALGDFRIGATGAGDLVLSKEAQHFTVLEAKMFSRLSQGVTHAPYYHQAARTVACIAEVLRRANRKPESMKSLSFFVLAPREQIDSGIFTKELGRESIRLTVERRVAEYNGAKSDWFESWFLPTLHLIEIGVKSWEDLLEVIGGADPTYGEELRTFYQKCLRFNRKVQQAANHKVLAPGQSQTLPA